MKNFYTFINEGKFGFIVLTLLDQDELKEFETDSVVSKWIDDERIKINKNELLVESSDKEVLDYFNKHYGFSDDHF